AFDNVLVVEKVDRCDRHRTLQQFESIRHERAALLMLQQASVVYRHALLYEGHALPAGVAPILVAAGEYLAVSIQGRLHRGVHILEDPGCTLLESRPWVLHACRLDRLLFVPLTASAAQNEGAMTSFYFCTYSVTLEGSENRKLRPWP